MAGSKLIPVYEVDATPLPSTPPENANFFSELEYDRMRNRAVLMNRLVQDPFYIMMNVSAPARIWMMRHLVNVADQLNKFYCYNLLQFFKVLSPEVMCQFLRYKNAPPEMTVIWMSQYPTTPKELPPVPDLVKIGQVAPKGNNKTHSAGRVHKR